MTEETTGQETEAVETDLAESTEDQPVESEDNQAEESPQTADTPELGEQLTAEQIKELRDGSMRQDDYTRKMQEMGTLRDELTSLKDEKVETDKYKGYTDEQRQARDMVTEIAREEAERMVKPLTERQQDVELRREMEDFKFRYELDDATMRATAKFADEQNLPFGVAYKAMNFDSIKDGARKEGEAKATQNITKRKAAFTESSTSNQKVSDEPVKGKLGWDVRAERAKQRLKEL